jgi:hypothetical protein
MRLVCVAVYALAIGEGTCYDDLCPEGHFPGAGL